MFNIGHSQCRNGPLVLSSMGHFKIKGANPASHSPRNIPAIVTVLDQYLKPYYVVVDSFTGF